MATGCFISTGCSLPSAVERVKLAESLGYETVYVTHIAGRESLTVLTAYALATTSLRLGTGVVPIYTRTPATMAQPAATSDELSGGRLTLGLGVSHRPVVISEGFLDELTAVGDERTLRDGIARYRDAGAGSPCVGPIAGTDFQTTLRAGISGA